MKIQTSKITGISFSGDDNPCNSCIASINIPVLTECATLCILEGYAWKCGKAISEGLQMFSSVELKYLAIKVLSASVNLVLLVDVSASASS